MAVSGVGIHITKSFGPLTLTSVFVPQTSGQDVIIFEAIGKVSANVSVQLYNCSFNVLSLNILQYRVDFTLGLYLKSPPGPSICNDILVPLIKVLLLIIHHVYLI